MLYCNFWQVIIFFTDHKTSLKHERSLAENQVKALKGIKLLPVAVGPHANIRELETITDNKLDIIHFGEYEKPQTVSKRIWHGTEMNFCSQRNILTWYYLGVIFPMLVDKSLEEASAIWIQSSSQWWNASENAYIVKRIF